MLRPLRGSRNKALCSPPGSARVNFLANAARAVSSAAPGLAAHLNWQAAKVREASRLQRVSEQAPGPLLLTLVPGHKAAKRENLWA